MRTRGFGEGASGELRLRILLSLGRYFRYLGWRWEPGSQEEEVSASGGFERARLGGRFED